MKIACLRICVALVLVVLVSDVRGQIDPAPRNIEPIFDWGIRDTSAAFGSFQPIPHVGHDYITPTGTLHNPYAGFYTNRHNARKPVGLMLRDTAGPYDGPRDRNALSNTMAYLHNRGYQLDYVFSDFETATATQNTLEMIRQVRSHPNPHINSASIGQYAAYAGTYDGSAHFPWITNRTDADTLYRTSGLNVSMPNCYPYQYFSVHASSAQWGTNVSPNVRSGLFWAPLERYSIAKRHLPTGHKLIPWVAGYVAWSGYGNNPPPQSDRTALIEHMRLRGSDGIYTLNSGISGLSDYDYKVEAHSTWRSMDWFFALPGQHRMLNLDTNKRAGTEWSGTARGNRTLVKVTNLGNTTATIAFPAIINGQKSGLPVRSPHISAGSHELLTYLDNHPMNQPFDGPIDTTLAANGWKGPGAGAWQIKSNAEPAAGSSTVASVPAASGGGTTWWKAANPGLLSNDRAVFSARVRGGADLSVVPVHIDTSIALHHVISASRAGPAFGLTGGLFTVTDSATGGPAYRATNLSSLSGRWYEIQILVDTAAFAEIWARDLTTNGQYLRLTFDNPNTPAIESITSVPISLGALNNLTVLNGWQITGSAGATLDALGMHLYPYVNGLRGPIDLLTEVTIPEPAGLALLLTATLPLYNRRRNNPPQ